MTTLETKQRARRRYVLAAFIFMCLIPISALVLLVFKIDPSPAAGIFSTSAATFSALIMAHFATAPKKDIG